MDSFYVLEGTLTINLAEGAEEVPAGGYALVPPGHPHTFSNPGEQAVRALNVSAPGGIELYVTKVAEAMADGSLTPELMAAVGAEHDVEPV
jgi:mannose-6-phosphate isomerase-like protein (cupin superfamily)